MPEAARPWTYEVHELSEGLSAIVYDANGQRVGTDHLSEADARLIAAAPQMLRALQRLQSVRPSNWDDGDDPELEAAWESCGDALTLAGSSEISHHG